MMHSVSMTLQSFINAWSAQVCTYDRLVISQFKKKTFALNSDVFSYHMGVFDYHSFCVAQYQNQSD